MNYVDANAYAVDVVADIAKEIIEYKLISIQLYSALVTSRKFEVLSYLYAATIDIQRTE